VCSAEDKLTCRPSATLVTSGASFATNQRVDLVAAIIPSFEPYEIQRFERGGQLTILLDQDLQLILFDIARTRISVQLSARHELFHNQIVYVGSAQRNCEAYSGLVPYVVAFYERNQCPFVVENFNFLIK
jgi:hypothetical protein